MDKTKNLFAGIVLGLLLLIAAAPGPVSAQSCGWRYCSTEGDCFGSGCQSSPCYAYPMTPPPSGMSLGSLVTDGFFNGILSQAAGNSTLAICAGTSFYTRKAFLEAASNYPHFGSVGSVDDSRREIAAFFAHLTHNTGHFCNIEETDGALRNYCYSYTTQYPCNPNKRYYGRGPIQISWNFNYGPAGQSIGFDGLNSPETVAEDPVISFRTASWFWMKDIHSMITSGQGFGSTIRAINVGECGGGDATAMQARIQYYTDYCREFGVSPGNNLTC